MTQYQVIFYWQGQRRGEIVIAYNDGDARSQVAAAYPGAQIVTVTRMQ